MPLTYGIDTALWVRLPPDDQAAVKAEFLGQPPPAIGGYAPIVPGPTATPVPATPAPPPTLSSSGAQAYALLNPPQGAKPAVGVVKPPQRATILPSAEVRASTLAAREAALGSVQAAIGKTGSVAPATGYYTYKDDVPLKPGQTLVFTKGRGYYAVGTPTPTKASTTPAEHGSNVALNSGITHYTYKDDVPLKVGQTLGFTPGKGYYAVGTPTAAKAAIPLASHSAPGVGGGITYVTRRDDVLLKPGQTVGFTPGKGYYARGDGADVTRLKRASAGYKPPPHAALLTPTLQRVQQAERLTVEQRVVIFDRFFTQYGGSGAGFGYGAAAVQFLDWEIASGRVRNKGGSDWWEIVNGRMAVDLRTAANNLARGAPAETKAVAAWMTFAKSAATGGARQRLFWAAHQLSLHEGITFAYAQTPRLSHDEFQFVQVATQLVDLAALGNRSSKDQGFFTIRNIVGTDYPTDYPASSSDVYSLAEDEWLAKQVHALPKEGNVGLASTRWRWW